MIIEYARVEGVRAIRGQVLNHNHPMLEMCKRLGFTIGPDPQNGDVSLVVLPIAKSTQ
jgi:acetyltransferase